MGKGAFVWLFGGHTADTVRVHDSTRGSVFWCHEERPGECKSPQRAHPCMTPCIGVSVCHLACASTHPIKVA